MRVIEHQPPEITNLRPNHAAVFLNGPIQGAPDWQRLAVRRFEASHVLADTLHVFNPRRPEMTDDFNYEEQVVWEKAQRKRAAMPGSALLFWYAAQDDSLPYEAGRQYAKTTEKELHRTFGWKDLAPDTNIAVGVDPDFVSLERYTISCFEEFRLTPHQTLAATCDDTLHLIKRQRLT